MVDGLALAVDDKSRMWREMYSLSAIAVASRVVPILAKFIFAQPW